MNDSMVSRLPDSDMQAARYGGTVAANARRQLEEKSGRKVVTANNYLTDKLRPRKLPPKSK